MTTLRDLRKAKGLTLMDLEDKTGISNGVLSRIERGQWPGSLGRAKELAGAYGVPLGEFIEAVATGASIKVKGDQALECTVLKAPAAANDSESLDPAPRCA